MQIEIESFFTTGMAVELVTDEVHAVPGWDPIPLMRFFKTSRNDQQLVLIAASIGALQWTLKGRQDLDKFMSEAIPTFCELT